MRDRLLTMVLDHPELPEFPEIVHRLEEMIADPDYGIREIAQLVESDLVLVGRLLKLANSAYYGGGRAEITSVQLAIQRLGLKQLKSIVYSVAFSRLFHEVPGIEPYNFWRHSLGVALFSKSLWKYVNVNDDSRETMYVAGLLHDVGITVFGTLAPKEYGEFLQKAMDVEESIYTQEIEAFGIDHGELGAAFIEHNWFVEPRVLAAVRYHHSPYDAPAEQKVFAEVAHMSDAICNNMGLDNGIEIYKEIFKEGVWNNLGLTLEDAEDIFTMVRDTMLQTEMMIK